SGIHERAGGPDPSIPDYVSIPPPDSIIWPRIRVRVRTIQSGYTSMHSSFKKALLLVPVSIMILLHGANLLGQPVGIRNGFPFPAALGDTATSPYLPSLPRETAGSRGFLK